MDTNRKRQRKMSRSISAGAAAIFLSAASSGCGGSPSAFGTGFNGPVNPSSGIGGSSDYGLLFYPLFFAVAGAWELGRYSWYGLGLNNDAADLHLALYETFYEPVESRVELWRQR